MSEREQIVAWLRGQGNVAKQVSEAVGNFYLDSEREDAACYWGHFSTLATAADAIERGDHLK